MIPGGPGGSGVPAGGEGRGAGKEMARRVRPRQLRSARVGRQHEGELWARPGRPVSGEPAVLAGAGRRIKENVARSRRIAEACARRAGAVLRSFSTANEVRDIDRFRQALGEEKLSAWGTCTGRTSGPSTRRSTPSTPTVGCWTATVTPIRRGSSGAGWRTWRGRRTTASPTSRPGPRIRPGRAEGLRLAERPAEVRPLSSHWRRSWTAAEGVDHRGRPADRRPAAAGAPERAVSTPTPFFAQLARLVRRPRTRPPSPCCPAPSPSPCRTRTRRSRWRSCATTCAGRLGRRVPARGGRRPRPASAHGRDARRTSRPVPSGRTAPAEKPTRITAEGPSNILMIQNLPRPRPPRTSAP